MNKAVLDTDTLSAIMRQDTSAVENVRIYLTFHSRLTISIFTRYEILRGLAAKNATSQHAKFNDMCQSLDILPMTDDVIIRAASIYGELHKRGQLIGDADILIAATCLEQGYEIVTNNTSHFVRIEGLTVHNWLTS
ncbi:type II toxin-antitoxin system VapC family toxin [Bythopirellula polymerisocia]|uniref:Ribonuclease VapC n=1 Tax=Bythopirellula polymerisocia TaxID=2528003 RepID=A0A5C6D079_9BACT|nr:type II toxin-antitoxin system VapC family toxin [Bythopirellula polymerisocia]TWU30312.1 tRNA(fMet)-specific endonuclease VapC [Bythopirellula polymerisocia]